MRRIRWVAAFVMIVWGGTARAVDWTSWAGGSARNAVFDGPAVDLEPSLATSSRLDDLLAGTEWETTSWTPVGAGSPVVRYDASLDRHLAYVYAQGGSGFSATAGAIFAIDVVSGQYVWGTDVGVPQMGSWSSPTYDPVTQTILMGGGNATVIPPSGPVTSTGSITALNATTGEPVWVAPLEKTVVNATAAVGGSLGNNKVYITDYNGFGTDGILYAINADPGDAIADGAIDWQVTIGGASGSTPAYHDGVVYVASINDGSGGSGWPSAKGQVQAFDAVSGDKLWQVAFPYDSSVGNPFGGLVYRDGHVYVASYEFYGDHQSAALLKIDATLTGGPGTYEGGDQARIVSNSLANRTDSIPLVWERSNGETVIISSGGIQGFGTTHTVTFFDGEDDGSFMGSTALTGGDSPFGYAGEDMGWAGNWTYQPIVVGNILYVAGPEVEWFGPSNHLWAIDLAELDARGWFDDPSSPFELSVDDPAVLADLGPGSSPAYYNGMLITYGPGGLFQTYGTLIPEPSTAIMLGIGAAFAIGLLRRRPTRHSGTIS